MDSDFINAKAVWFKNNVSQGETASSVQACRPATNAADIKGNVAVFSRANCDTATQLRNAKEAGAIGVLVLNIVGAGPANLRVNEKILPGGTIQPVPFDFYATAIKAGEPVLLSFGPGVGVLSPQLESSKPPPGLVFASRKDLSIISTNTDIFLNYPPLWKTGNSTLLAAFTDPVTGNKNFSTIFIDGQYNQNAQVISSVSASDVNFNQTVSLVFNTRGRNILVSIEQNSRIVLWDVTNFSSFRKISFIQGIGYVSFCLYTYLQQKATHLLLMGIIYYDTYAAPEIMVVDATDPDNPQHISTLKEPSVFTLIDPLTGNKYLYTFNAVITSPDGRLLAACAGSAGLLVYDLLNPSQPVLLASLFTPVYNSTLRSNCQDNQFITVKNKTMLCAGHTNGYMFEKNCFVFGVDLPFSFKAKNVSSLNNHPYSIFSAASNPNTVATEANDSSVITIWTPKKVSAGTWHSCVLYYSGSVRCWGAGAPIGYGSQYPLISPISKSIEFYDATVHAAIVDIHSGAEHNCAIANRTSGRSYISELFCWGNGLLGRLGYGNEDPIGDNTSPRQVGPLLFTDAIPLRVFCGYYHTCAIMINTTSNATVVRCWGDNSMGQLGYAVRVGLLNASRAQDIVVGGVPKELALGAFHTCVLMEDGRMKCWGYGKSGQTGYGGVTFPLSSPVASIPTILFPNNLTYVKSFCAGNSHTCALMEDDQVYCWGSNYRGQLGRSLKTSKAYAPEIPVRITNSSEVVRSVHCGQVYTCVTFQSGRFHCWGDNLQRELGVLFAGTVLDAPNSVPLTPINYKVQQIAAGALHTCAIISRVSDSVAAAVRCWGNNVGGSRSLLPGYPQITNALNGSDTNVNYRATSLAAYYHTCAVMEPGSVKCWGPAASGALGTNVLENQGILLPASGSPNSFIPQNELVRKLSIGWLSTCVLFYSGRLSCWGVDYSGLRSVGLAAVTNATAGGNGVVADICFAFFGQCVLFQNGSIYCWGFLENRGVAKAYPIKWRDGIQGRAIQITGGQYYMCALFDNGKVACFGVATGGVLGLGFINFDWIRPFETFYINLGPRRAVKISGGSYHVCALLDSGDVICWGAGYFGQLGYGSHEDIGDDEDPFDVGYVDIGPFSAIDVSCGDAHTCVVVQANENRKIMCWGFNYNGQLGYGREKGNVGDDETPAQLGALNMTEDFVQVAAGVAHTCALTSTGTLKCWGAGKTGVLGYGDQLEVRDPASRPAISLSCGNNIRDANEECDDGNFRNGDGCSIYCLIEKNWHCRDTDGMFSLCTLCGDFLVMGSEQCDDGNVLKSDGCSANCQIEMGWNCSYARGTVCSEIHGDGLVVGSEQCDDGNQMNDDGCSVSGAIESGYSCLVSNNETSEYSSVCRAICGNGQKAASEECDDGNFNDGDGCSSSCEIEDGATCFLSCSRPDACQSICSFGDNNDHIPLIVGLAVGLPLLFLLIVLIVLFITLRFRKRRIEIDEEDLVFAQTIRQTVFGEVYKATWRESTVVEVKKMNIDKMSRDNVKLFLKEARMMQALPPHPNLVQFLGVAKSEENLLIVYEYIENGTIENLFHEDVSKTITLKNQLQLCVGICAGMDHLHSNGVVHRDLAARNVLVNVQKLGQDNTLTPKISDFGLARPRAIQKALPVRWMAPEVLDNSGVATKESDVWSFGVVIYEIFSRCLKPYKEKTNPEVIQFVSSGGKVDIPEDAPPVIVEIMFECLRYRSDWRPTFRLLSGRFADVLRGNSADPETSISMSAPPLSTYYESQMDDDYFVVNQTDAV